MKKKYLAMAMALILTLPFAIGLAEGDEATTGEATPTPVATPTQAATPAQDIPGGKVDPRVDTLIIDTGGIYNGMGMSYDSGYKPAIKGDEVNIILPLIINPSSNVKNMAGNSITVVPNLGSATDTPFIFDGVHQRAVTLKGSITGTNYAGVNKTYFLLTLPIKLKSERIGGEYSVTLQVNYTPEGESDIYTQDVSFIVPVTAKGTAAATLPPTATNGGDGNDIGDNGSDLPTDDGVVDVGGSGVSSGGGGGGSGTTSTPRLMLAEFDVSKNPVMAGEEFDLSISLRNTNTKAAIKNLIITFTGESSDIVPAGKTDSVFLKSIKADGTEKVTMRMKVRNETEPKPQKIGISVNGEDNSGGAITADLAVLVDINQPTRMEYDEPVIPSDVNAGDDITISFNIYNKGKGTLNNVMCKLEVPGLLPSSRAFLGNIPAGETKPAELSVFVGTKDMAYGDEPVLEESEDDEPVTSPDTSVSPDTSASPDDGDETNDDTSGGSSLLGPIVAKAAPTTDEPSGSPDTSESPGTSASPDTSAEPDATESPEESAEPEESEAPVREYSDYEKYGRTYGRILITYEDGYGEEFTEAIEVVTNINQPDISNIPLLEEEPEPETAGQWWVSVLIAGGVIALIVAGLIINNRRKKNRISLEDDDI